MIMHSLFALSFLFRCVNVPLTQLQESKSINIDLNAKTSYIELINLHEHHSFLSLMSFLSDVLKDDDLSRYQSK